MEFSQLVSSLGFPAVMCAWFMFRTENRLDKLTEAIGDLKDVLEVLELKTK